jgi:hypothetical protein
LRGIVARLGAIGGEMLKQPQRWPITFRWRDSAHPNEQKLLSLSLDEILCRFLLHILPKGFVRIRNFGFLANRKRATLLPLCFSGWVRNNSRKQNNNTPLPPKAVPILGAARNAVDR